MATNHHNTMMGEEVQRRITNKATANKNSNNSDDNDTKDSSPIPSHHQLVSLSSTSSPGQLSLPAPKQQPPLIQHGAHQHQIKHFKCISNVNPSGVTNQRR
jgi:hypothetical protein